MSVEQARTVIATQFRLTENSFVYGYADYNHRITSVRFTSDKLIVSYGIGIGKKVVFIFSEISQISSNDQTDYTSPGNLQSHIYFAGKTAFFMYGAHSEPIVNALYVLKQNAMKAKKEADEYDARFAASLAEYRKLAASNTALSEEANRYKVQAEGAVRDKQFIDAADFYAKALKIVPWWPAGHFNRALVLGETGDYGDAKREMNYYLQLVPDALNARAAQDKIYDWERKAGKEN